MDKDGSAKRILTRTLGAAALLALLIWGLSPYQHPHSIPPAAIAPSAAPAPGAAPAIAASPGRVTTTTAHDNGGEVEVEVCGRGKVHVDADDTDGSKYVGALSRPIITRWLASLAGSRDARARAAGLMLSPLGDADNRDFLATMALGSSDPAIYAMALNACRLQGQEGGEGPCARLSVGEWAELDPSNGVPWLQLAGAARAAKNPAAEAAAFRHLAGSSQFDPYAISLLSFAEPAIPADATPLERQYLLTGAMGVVAATAIPLYQEIGRYCSKDGVQDEDVRQQCARVAELLVVKGTTTLDLMVGKSTGARAGWPEDRVAAVAQYGDALRQSAARASPSLGPAMWSCESVQAANRYLRAVAEVGEVAAARDAMLQSGNTPAELATQWQEFLNSLQREGSVR